MYGYFRCNDGISFSDRRKNLEFVHDSPNRFIAVMYSIFSFNPHLNASTSVCLHEFPACLAGFYLCQQYRFSGFFSFSPKVGVITASGYAKESTHLTDRYLFCGFLNDLIFCTGTHFLSVISIKFRSSAFF